MTLLTPDKTLFESVTCGRCCGTGHYSYNAINGTRCFGCHGSGVTLTKRGSAAAKMLRASLCRPASEIKVGDLIQFDMHFFKCWSAVTAVEYDAANAEVTIRGIREKTGETISFGGMRDSPVRMQWTAEQKKPYIEAALAFQASLTKMGKPRKVAA